MGKGFEFHHDALKSEHNAVAMDRHDKHWARCNHTEHMINYRWQVLATMDELGIWHEQENQIELCSLEATAKAKVSARFEGLHLQRSDYGMAQGGRKVLYGSFDDAQKVR